MIVDNMQNARQELGDEIHRLKIVRINFRDILAFLYQRPKVDEKNIIEQICLPEKQLPDGYKIIAVNCQWVMPCLEVLIWHPSFDKVPEFQQPPLFNDWNMNWTVRVLATEEEVHARYAKVPPIDEEAEKMVAEGCPNTTEVVNVVPESPTVVVAQTDKPM